MNALYSETFNLNIRENRENKNEISVSLIDSDSVISKKITLPFKVGAELYFRTGKRGNSIIYRISRISGILFQVEQIAFKRNDETVTTEYLPGKGKTLFDHSEKTIPTNTYQVLYDSRALNVIEAATLLNRIWDFQVEKKSFLNSMKIFLETLMICNVQTLSEETLTEFIENINFY